MPLTRDEDIAELLKEARTIAVVGASDRPDRPSRPGHANFIGGIGTDPVLFERAYAHRGQCVHGPLAAALRAPGM